MKPMQKIVSLILLAMLAVLPALSLAADTATEAQTYTVEQMLTLAIQDEYAARATYTAIQDAFGTQAPFANIDGAEANHVAELAPLFAAYGLTVPADTATATAPATLAEAYATGVAAETANIAMYASFLKQSDLPADVRAVFTALQSASANHLAAFTRNAERGDVGGRYGMGGGMMGGRGQGMMDRNTTRTCDPDDCPMGGVCGATNDGSRGGWGRNR